MKLLIFCGLASMASIYACAQRINVPEGSKTFRELIKIIEKQSPFTFVYTKEQLAHIPDKIAKNTSTYELTTLLNQRLQNTPISYLIENNFIILVTGSQDTTTVTGKVVTEDGNPVAGATVQIKNDGRTFITDQCGEFLIRNARPSITLLISGAEINPSEFTFNTSAYIELKVSELIRELDETVILGYGTTTRRYNTGNVVKITGPRINRQGYINLQAALQGRVPGLLIRATSGAPSASYLVQVRGQHSINPNPLINYLVPTVDQPLFVVNGVPFAPQNNNVNQLTSVSAPGSLDIYQNPYGGISPFSTINPADIESIEVLKDPVTTSLYGSRAANGVILITTRETDNKPLSIQTMISTGVVINRSFPAMLSTKQYLQLRRDAFQSDSIQPSLLPGSPGYAPDIMMYDSSRYTNWARYLFHTAVPITSIHITTSAANGPLHFTSSLGYRSEQLLLKGHFFSKQLSGNARVRYLSANNRMNSTASVYYSAALHRSAASPLILQSIALPPNYPDPRDANGNLNWNHGHPGSQINPAALLLQTYQADLQNFIANLKIEYHLSAKVRMRVNTGYSGFASDESSTVPRSSLSPTNQFHVRFTSAGSFFRSFVAEPQLEYKSTVRRLFIYSLVAGTFQHHDIQMQSQRGSGYDSSADANSFVGSGRIDRRSIEDRYSYKSIISSLRLHYAERYLLSITGRLENSSRFVSGSKTGQFFSTGLAWIFSEEKLIKQRKRWLNYAKLRFSYGTSGNDDIGYRHFLDAWSRTPTYTAQSLTTGIANIPFSWSLTQKAETGLEAQALKNRLSLNLSIYHHRSSRQLISRLINTQTGIVRYFTNANVVVYNRGIECVIGFRSDQKHKLQWSSELNISRQTDKLHAFDDIVNTPYVGRYWVGQSLQSKKVNAFSGVDPLSGIFLFNNDQESFINTTPLLFGGLMNEFQYGRWKGEWLLEFRQQTEKNTLYQIYARPPGLMFNQSKILDHYWKQPGDVARFQKTSAAEISPAGDAAYLLRSSDGVYSKFFFIRSNNIRLSYSFKNLKPFFVKEMESYIQGQNIFTISSADIGDPDYPGIYRYPASAVIILGITIKM